jgi:hypothetical protein
MVSLFLLLMTMRTVAGLCRLPLSAELDRLVVVDPLGLAWRRANLSMSPAESENKTLCIDPSLWPEYELSVLPIMELSQWHVAWG